MIKMILRHMLELYLFYRQCLGEEIIDNLREY